MAPRSQGRSQRERQTVAGAVVFDREGRVLLVRRARPPGVGTWSLPGGRLEAGETPEAAAVREVREETALQTRPVCRLGVVDVDAEGQGFAIHEHLLTLLDDAPDLARAGDDASEVRWVPAADLADVPVTAAVAQVVARGLAEAVARGLTAAAPPLTPRSTRF